MSLILLDTHVLVWIFENNDKLGRESSLRIEQAYEERQLGLSTISFWELAMLEAKSRLVMRRSLDLLLEDLELAETVLFAPESQVALMAGRLPNLHGDPADRFIVATALARDATLVTADERILAWPGALRRLDARQ